MDNLNVGNKNEISLKNAKRLEDEADLTSSDRLPVLMPRGSIPGGILMLTGSAAGVSFKSLDIWNLSRYLQPGDLVRIEGSWPGHLENAVIGEGR